MINFVSGKIVNTPKLKKGKEVEKKKKVEVEN
jgi:hypothetical protein